MSPLNHANANKLENELVGPHVALIQNPAARATFEGQANDLLARLRNRETDDIEYAYQVRNRLIHLLLAAGVEARSGTGNVFAEVRGNNARIDLGLGKDRIPQLRSYESPSVLTCVECGKMLQVLDAELVADALERGQWALLGDKYLCDTCKEK